MTWQCHNFLWKLTFTKKITCWLLTASYLGQVTALKEEAKEASSSHTHFVKTFCKAIVDSRKRFWGRPYRQELLTYFSNPKMLFSLLLILLIFFILDIIPFLFILSTIIVLPFSILFYQELNLLEQPRWKLHGGEWKVTQMKLILLLILVATNNTKVLKRLQIILTSYQSWDKKETEKMGTMFQIPVGTMEKVGGERNAKRCLPNARTPGELQRV